MSEEKNNSATEQESSQTLSATEIAVEVEPLPLLVGWASATILNAANMSVTKKRPRPAKTHPANPPLVHAG